MKIIKPPDDVDPYIIAERHASEEGNKCPFCDATRDNYVIEMLFQSVWYVGWIRRKKMTSKSFTCLKCGAKWESEPYECR